MTIERRHSKRFDLDITAQIIHRGRSIPVRIKDLSEEGLLLNAESLTIPTGMLIDISFYLDRKEWELSALVIWSSQNSVGVMFKVAQPTLFQSVVGPNLTTLDHGNFAPIIQLPTSRTG